MFAEPPSSVRRWIPTLRSPPSASPRRSLVVGGDGREDGRRKPRSARCRIWRSSSPPSLSNSRGRSWPPPERRRPHPPRAPPLVVQLPGGGGHEAASLEREARPAVRAEPSRPPLFPPPAHPPPTPAASGSSSELSCSLLQRRERQARSSSGTGRPKSGPWSRGDFPFLQHHLPAPSSGRLRAAAEVLHTGDGQAAAGGAPALRPGHGGGGFLLPSTRGGGELGRAGLLSFFSERGGLSSPPSERAVVLPLPQADGRSSGGRGSRPGAPPTPALFSGERRPCSGGGGGAGSSSTSPLSLPAREREVVRCLRAE
ncbi:unnamed protein product [Urochloa humidicola]